MAYAFAGAGSATDRILVDDYAEINSQDVVSMAMWSFQVSAGASNLGRRMTKINSLEWFDSGANARWEARRWTTDGRWTCPRSLNVWEHHVVTYNYGATTNDPVVYVNGATVTVTETQTPVGTLGTDTSDLFIG